jgi:pimeloyl-ACP methyl ester carboxylesterase
MDKSKSKEIGEVVDKHEASGKYINIDGIKTFVLDQGNGEVVFCIHGVPTSSFLYRKLVRSLSKMGFRGVAVDLPGLGLSGRPADFDYSFSGFSKFLAKVVTELNIQNFHLVVHDIGGPIGFALASNHPEWVKSLTILNTWVDVVNFKKPLVMRAFENKILGEAELAMITHTTWPIMFSKMGVNNSDLIPDEEIKAYVDLLKRGDDGKAFLKIMRNFEDSSKFKETCFSAIKDVPYPVQAIWGKDDPALTVERYGEEIKEVAGLPKINLLNSRHFLQEEVYEQIANLIDTQAKSFPT